MPKCPKLELRQSAAVRLYALVGLRVYKRPQTARLRGQFEPSWRHQGKRPKRRPAPRLYLVTPPVGDLAGLTAALADALAAGDVAAVLLRLPEADERTLITQIKRVAALVQDTGAALLLDGHPELVARAGADGAHLDGHR